MALHLHLHLHPPLTLMLTLTLTHCGLQKGKQKPPKGQYERMARIPRNQLPDQLFRLFQEREHWPIKALRERTQQPEAYLKDVLAEGATLHRSGENNGTWELMANFKGGGVSGCLLVLFF